MLSVLMSQITDPLCPLRSKIFALSTAEKSELFAIHLEYEWNTVLQFIGQGIGYIPTVSCLQLHFAESLLEEYPIPITCYSPNQFPWDLGLPVDVDEGQCYDVYGLDEELLEMVPKPDLSVPFLYPVTTKLPVFLENDREMEVAHSVAATTTGGGERKE
ncbi:hypothetical protein VNO77_25045 [Canavalia gladiata]|uniref:Uncharacterized protein n=1 Tax=Canavalia gladiata TaxID=3824 RepID=A0AAN9L818_CANGL